MHIGCFYHILVQSLDEVSVVGERFGCLNLCSPFLATPRMELYYFSILVVPLEVNSTNSFIILTSTLLPGINYFVVITHPLNQL